MLRCVDAVGEQHVDERQAGRRAAAVCTARQDAADRPQDRLSGAERRRQGQLDLAATIHTRNAGRLSARLVKELNKWSK